MKQTLSTLSTCDVSPPPEKLSAAPQRLCFISCVTSLHMLRAENTQRITALFSKSYAALANLTTDWNLGASLQQGKLIQCLLDFKVYSDAKLFVKHTGIQAQSRIMCGQRYSITLKKYASENKHVQTVIFQRRQKPFSV